LSENKSDMLSNGNTAEVATPAAVAPLNSRREFFKKGLFVSAAAAATVAPVRLLADDPAIMKEPKWATKLGYAVDRNLYGQPSPYEHNVLRRTHDLLSSGDKHASVAMTPIQELNGIITPNGLFF